MQNSEIMSEGEAEAAANFGALKHEVDTLNKWTVDDVLTELGGTGRDATARLAEKLLDARGLEATKKNIENQQRSINRWLNYERGTGKESRKPNKEMQAAMNKIGRNAQMARDGFTVAMSGDISVNGYRRSNRNAKVHLQGEHAEKFLNSPNWGSLAAAYGASELHGYGNVDIKIV